MTVGDLENAISAQNVVNPAGQIGGAPAPAGQQTTYSVTAQGRLMTAEQFGDIIVRANPDGSLIRLKDVARIELGTESYTQQASTNGLPSAIVGLYQNPGSNALAAANLAKAKMAELARHFPSDMQVGLTLDTTIPITEGAREIVKTLLEAILLVLLVVFIFLQNWRATLIPMLTIPVSLVGAFMFFPAVGFTINTLALLGLVLAVGLVVDDAIVVVEAIEAKIDRDALLVMPRSKRWMKSVERWSASHWCSPRYSFPRHSWPASRGPYTSNSRLRSRFQSCFLRSTHSLLAQRWRPCS